MQAFQHRGQTDTPPPTDTHIPAKSAARRPVETWAAVWSALILLAALIVFIAQNTHSVEISFLSLHGKFPLAVALLAAAVVGAILPIVLGTTHALRLRRSTKRVRNQQQRLDAAAQAAHESTTAAQHPETRTGPLD